MYEQIKPRVIQLREYDADSLLRRGKEFNFEPLRPQLIELQSALELFSKKFFVTLPDLAQREINKATNDLATPTNNMSGFNWSSPTFVDSLRLSN